MIKIKDIWVNPDAIIDVQYVQGRPMVRYSAPGFDKPAIITFKPSEDAPTVDSLAAYINEARR